MAKIEKPSAVENIDSILEVADAIMVARGDLAVELPFEMVPGVQRHLIDRARVHRKPVIVATEMLESMTRCHVPTRAETSDVAYAIRSGADAVMLSAESASGDYPEEAVMAMAKIARQAEIDFFPINDKILDKTGQTSMTRAVCDVVSVDGINTIAAFTEYGRTAINISNGRPGANIMALTPNIKTSRKLCLVWGVRSILIEEIYSFSQMVQIVQRKLCRYCKLENHAKVAIVAGIPFRISGATNILHVCAVDNSIMLDDEE